MSRCVPMMLLGYLVFLATASQAADSWQNVLGKQLTDLVVEEPAWRYYAKQWQRVLLVNAEEPCFLEDGSADLPSTYQMQWDNMRDMLPSLPPLEKVKSVSGFINSQFSHQNDTFTYGLQDIWNSPMEFVSMGKGDCEDFAIAKYFALRALGISAENLRLLLVEIPSLGIRHVLLGFFHAGSIYIIDSNFNPPALALAQSEAFSRYYRLHYAFNEDGAWQYR